MTDLQALSDSISQIVAQLSASIVRVDSRRSPASGFVYQPGVVVASNHAIERDEAIRVAGEDGKTHDAKLRGRDPSTDLAVLEVPSSTAPAISGFADDTTLKVGHLALAIARPGELSATLGIVRALDEAWRTHAGGRIDRWLECDLDLPRGFSGGLLADASGRAIGVNDSGLVRGRSLAIPGRTVKRVVEAILARGAVQRGFLGIGSHPIRLPAALAGPTGQETALIVISVQPGGPADKAGILIGDLVVALDGKPTEDVGELVSLLDEDRIGKETALKIVRAGELREMRVTVGARSAS